MMESTKVSSPQGTPSSHSVRSRATSQAPEANDSGAGGFLALLAALGDMADGQDGGASFEQAGEGGDPTLLGTTDAADRPLDPSEVAAWQSLLVPAGATVSAGVPQPGTTSGVGTQGALGVQMGGELPTAMLNGANGLPGGIVAETAMLDTSADLKQGPPQGGGMAYGRNTSRLQNALAQRADAVETSSFSSRSQSSVASLQSASPQAGWAAAFQALGERAAAGSIAMGAPTRLAGGTPGVEAGGGISLSEPLLSPGGDARPSGGAFGGSSAGEGRFAPVAASDSGNAAAPVEPGALDGAAPFAESVHAGVEEQIAEQVAYWVNQKTQNAEISINRDGQPAGVAPARRACPFRDVGQHVRRPGPRRERRRPPSPARWRPSGTGGGFGSVWSKFRAAWIRIGPGHRRLCVTVQGTGCGRALFARLTGAAFRTRAG